MTHARMRASRHGGLPMGAWLLLTCALLARSAAGQVAVADPVREDGSQSVSAESRSYFYKGLPGSDLYVGPIDVLLNHGFNWSQTLNRDRRIFEAQYGVEHVRNSVLHPLESISNSGGWGTFLTSEIVPIHAVDWIRSGFDWNNAGDMAWFPNYFGHLIEGGITSRRLAEKLRAQGVPWATGIAAATFMGAALVNEMYTHPELVEGTGSTTADLYIFDPLGVLLFSLDPVARFFAETLHASVWPSQASIAQPGLELTNNANNLVFKIPLPFTDRASLFFRTAVGAHLGATLHLADDYDLSLGIGMDATRQNIDPASGSESVDVRMSSSLYLDRGGSVLASVVWSQVKYRLLAINVYPGVFHSGFGGWLVVTQDKALEIGLSHHNALGLGLGVGLGR